jgi:uncharacterized protein YfaT (DUF1175 family)
VAGRSTGSLEVMDSALPAVVASGILCVLTYGLVAIGLGHVLATGKLRGAGAVAVYVIALCALAIPCMFVALEVAKVLPSAIVWGHAGEMFYLPYAISSVIVFVAALVVYVPRMSARLQNGT